ncbi:cysteine--tRNA ligase [Candidatus Izemoplasma sp. B36]|uniref:cysteine--tRNA ligase n=1 Tax=Candidatus Izemoplasma sp. B36 TaxID=3242468 RepID=UPI0035563763
MKIYNSYTDSLEEFKSIYPNKVGMYVCGPTVYNYIHIGNARPVVFFDTVRRYFESKNMEVTFVSNFTDVDDKIIQKAKDENKPEIEVSSFYINAFLEDVKSLNCKMDYIKPKVTKYMNHIIDYIQSLVDKGYAYIIEGDVYFRVSKIEDYGALSNREIDDLISGSRVDVNTLKENPLDFTLWKKTDEGINFDSPFSKGRPGWHTECVAMIDDIFGEKIDIHGGGMDLKFPHHENEIAQAKATHNHQVANYWMHNGRLSFKDIKMSKSLGNVILVKDVKEKMALRYFLLSTHYRSPLNYSDESFSMYIKEWNKLENTLKSLFFKLDINDKRYDNIDIINEDIVKEIENFKEAMDNDFNTANAITALQSILRLTNVNIRKKDNYDLLNQLYKSIMYMIGIIGLRVELNPISKENRNLYNAWQLARKNKEFNKADELRKTLTDRGVL